MPAPLSDSLLKLIHSYRRQIQQASVDAELNLPASYLRIFKCLQRIEHCTVQKISQRLERDKAQITRIINELVQQGLVVKQKHPQDQRSQILTLSEQGLQIYQRFLALEQQSQTKMANGLSADEVSAFERIANKMIDNLNNH